MFGRGGEGSKHFMFRILNTMRYIRLSHKSVMRVMLPSNDAAVRPCRFGD